MATCMSTRSGIPEVFRKMARANVGTPLLFAMLFLWINGLHWWGPYWEAETALAYIMMMLVALRTAEFSKNRRWWLSSSRPTTVILNIWVVFLAAFAILLVMDDYAFAGALSGPAASAHVIYPTIALHAFFVAPVEETLFRGVLKDYTQGWRLYTIPLSPIVTSAGFAVFHISVYGGEVMSLWWAFIMGFIFFYITDLRVWKRRGGARREPLGVPGAIGAHLCYNLFVLGILTWGV